MNEHIKRPEPNNSLMGKKNLEKYFWLAIWTIASAYDKIMIMISQC